MAGKASEEMWLKDLYDGKDSSTLISSEERAAERHPQIRQEEWKTSLSLYRDKLAGKRLVIASILKTEA